MTTTMNANEPDFQDVFAPIVAAAEQVLSDLHGGPVRLGDVTCLTEEGRRNILEVFLTRQS